MKIKIAAAAVAVGLGAAACDQGERQVADQDAPTVTGAPTQDGAATPPAAGRPAPNGVSDAQRPGATPGTATPTTPGVEPDDLGQSEAANAVQDAAAGIVGQTNAAVVGGDTEAFLRNAALGDMYEIEAGKIALQMSTSPAVREIAQTIVADHEKMSTDLMTTVARARISFTAPTLLDERRQGMIDNLEAADADDFDDVFLEQQESAHEEALALLRAYASRGDVAEIKAAAQKAISTIEAHLDSVRAAQAALEGAG